MYYSSCCWKQKGKWCLFDTVFLEPRNTNWGTITCITTGKLFTCTTWYYNQTRFSAEYGEIYTITFSRCGPDSGRGSLSRVATPKAAALIDSRSERIRDPDATHQITQWSARVVDPAWISLICFDTCVANKGARLERRQR